ncbi:CrcB protein [Weissella koreensis KACC 15510]|uniref:fluoride efflux transporter FluC n=1 Tax=Weissella koreensis TaxID=165096 RepID=UPI0002174AED|nr:CrcB family protein [Weissella koreensis]AEJ23235.1 CrcB protein [Weissella koreensis KACC 15510]
MKQDQNHWLGQIAMIGVGGFIGGALRESVEIIFQNMNPLGTLVINLTGTFLTVLLTEILIKKLSLLNQIQSDFIFVGIMGAYTTYSTLMLELTKLTIFPALLYCSISIIGGVLMVYAAEWAGGKVIQK